jgi:transcriptional regulator with XRE-family HTH domain
MDRVREIFKKSKLTQHELGVRMGYPAESARKSVWQFLKSEDPRVSVLQRFVEAVQIPIEDLLRGK